MSEIHQYLRKLNSLGRPIYYCPNPGNGGDSIIASATFQAFRDCGLDFRICPWDDNSEQLNFGEHKPLELSEIILIYPGGGNLVNSYYGTARKVMENYHNKVFKFVLLPHTVNTHEDLLENLGFNVDLICREKVSYNYVKETALRANTFLMDDLAFSLNAKKLLGTYKINYFNHAFLKFFYKMTDSDRFNNYISPNRAIAHELMILRRKIAKLFFSKENVLHAFRTDSEKTYLSIPSDNIDLSHAVQYGTHEEILAFQTSKIMLNFIELFDEVRTNRLHIAVPSALLGKKVYFHANSYYKCKAIFEYSMKDRFPNVVWVEDQNQ